MKKFKFAFLFFAILSIAACADDDDGITDVCAQTDWVGTYSGTVDCDGAVEDVTVTIAASGAANILVSYQTATVQTEFGALPFDGCDLTANATGSGLSIVLNGSLTGRELSVREVTTVDSTNTSTTCVIIATRN
ncbi:hypothetical protein [Neolewinella persica]|uniref:hypothetical protein n=1 Tax=Neolewinella persica TaxID=70998 RepID=UPI00036938E8|nr:hypothetical protein [Neolewinella persica]